MEVKIELICFKNMTKTMIMFSNLLNIHISICIILALSGKKQNDYRLVRIYITNQILFKTNLNQIEICLPQMLQKPI